MRMGKAKRLLPHVIGISGGFCVNRRNLPPAESLQTFGSSRAATAIVAPEPISSLTMAGTYAVLRLTEVRMLPVFLCLIGTRTSTADRLFIGGFRPRGLATIVFAVLVIHERLPVTTRS